MSMLKQLPDFRMGQKLARAGKWSLAMDEFSRCSDVLSRSDQRADAAISGLYVASSQYYTGHLELSHRSFCANADMLSSLGTSTALQTARRYAIVTGYLLDSPEPMDPTQHDSWSQLMVNSVPQKGTFANNIWMCLQTGEPRDLGESCSEIEKQAVAHALLFLAKNEVDKLPAANTQGVDVGKQTEQVTRALKAGESIAALGDENVLVSKWYIGNSLLLRGRLFEFNGNALMAEGMYRAAADLAASFKSPPRINLLRNRALNRLGELLCKWEKREQEGENLKENNPTVVPRNWNDATFIPEPTFGELDRLIEN
jgi:hypothetical protein